MQRGVIRNADLSLQQYKLSGMKSIHTENRILDMSLLRWNKITPTNIDMFCVNGQLLRVKMMIDFGCECFVLGEFKHVAAKENAAQRIALLSLAANSNVPCLVFLAEHNFGGDKIVLADACKVRWYWTQNFKEPQHLKKKLVTVFELIDGFVEKHGSENLKQRLKYDEKENHEWLRAYNKREHQESLLEGKT